MNSEIELPADSVSDDLGLLMELLGDEPAVATVKRKPRKCAAIGVADMSPGEFRNYKAQKQAERRAKLKARKDAGSVIFNSTSAREALADAALLILATGGLGADDVMSYLGSVYHDQLGAPLTIRARAKSGHMKPRLLHIARG